LYAFYANFKTAFGKEPLICRYFKSTCQSKIQVVPQSGTQCSASASACSYTLGTYGVCA